MRKINFGFWATILWGYILAVLLLILAGLLWQADGWFSRIVLLVGLWLPVAVLAFGVVVSIALQGKGRKGA